MEAIVQDTAVADVVARTVRKRMITPISTSRLMSGVSGIALLAGARPDFFDGTPVETYARTRLAQAGG